MGTVHVFTNRQMSKKPSKSLSVKQLELLISLSSSDSIASAGARLGMTASATSHALRTLEATLGTPLVERNTIGVRLTYAAQQILPHVRDVFASLQIVRATASASAGLRTGLLTLGSLGASSSLNLIPPLLERFKARYPGVEVGVTEQPDLDLERALIERRIEIGMAILPKPDFDTLPLVTDQLMAILPEGHPLSRLEAIDANDLVDFPLIMTRAGSEPAIIRMFERADVTPHIAHNLSQIISILEFVRRGLGISVLASMVLPPSYDGLIYKKIHPPVTKELGLVCLNERRLSPAARAFWLLVQESAPDLKTLFKNQEK